jgi:hypothetical protein
MKPIPFVVRRAESEKKPSPCTKEAAAKRRETINDQIDEFFANGGKVKKLPAFDEVVR